MKLIHKRVDTEARLTILYQLREGLDVIELRSLIHKFLFEKNGTVNVKLSQVEGWVIVYN